MSPNYLFLARIAFLHQPLSGFAAGFNRFIVLMTGCRLDQAGQRFGTFNAVIERLLNFV